MIAYKTDVIATLKKYDPKMVTIQNKYIYFIKESFWFYFFAIGLDFIIVFVFLENYIEVFLVVALVIGLLIPAYTVKFKKFGELFILGKIISIHKIILGRSLIIYDLLLVCIFIILLLLFPVMLDSAIDLNGKEYGREIFLFIYPVIDMVLELFIDIFAKISHHGEFFFF